MLINNIQIRVVPINQSNNSIKVNNKKNKNNKISYMKTYVAYIVIKICIFCSLQIRIFDFSMYNLIFKLLYGFHKICKCHRSVYS